MCRLVPVWKEILARHDSAVRFVLCLRNPGEVAASLASRDGIPASQGLALWVEHLCAAEADTRDEARMFVDYSDLLTNGIQTASRIAEFIGLPFRKSAVEFLDPNLRRERADLEPPPVCRELHRLAKSDGTELRNMVDEIRALLSFREHAVRTERKSLLERLK